MNKPKIRFEGYTEAWEQRKFGELVEKYEDPVDTPTDGYMRLGIRSHAKGTFHSFVEAGKELETAKMFRVAANNFIVNGVKIKNPSSFKIERYNVTNMERLANAEMVGDLIAKKKKFYFTYDAITGEDLDNILKLCDAIQVTPSELLGYDVNSKDRELSDILNSDPELKTFVLTRKK